ncbi:hypothetical protein LOAG_00560 [Loa loa]|uniref:Uncharacterized protein n=1 Tax=Loa loa TaxID=7209 RepID=A0A1S0UD17_LOALO|nr:hypothetical protein LOAG_00560 [Loa loa]EFO27923.1 hypothetical protein LOAG_00560 [Loa loa]
MSERDFDVFARLQYGPWEAPDNFHDDPELALWTMVDGYSA